MKTAKMTESKFAEFGEILNCIRSSLILMQQAIENEANPATLQDVDNNLEILITTFDDGLDKLNKVFSEIFIEE